VTFTKDDWVVGSMVPTTENGLPRELLVKSVGRKWVIIDNKRVSIETGYCEFGFRAWPSNAHRQAELNRAVTLSKLREHFDWNGPARNMSTEKLVEVCALCGVEVPEVKP